ncbi:MAG: hypothetical protein AB7P99_00990 [Vicinamibacterales bacterium]
MRRHLAAFALIMVSLHAAVSPLGALRACLAPDHTHAGGEHDCPHHQSHTMAGMEGHDHAQMGHSMPPAAPSQEPALTCGCANDPLGMLSVADADVPDDTPATLNPGTPGPSDLRTPGPSDPRTVPSPPPRS